MSTPHAFIYPTGESRSWNLRWPIWPCLLVRRPSEEENDLEISLDRVPSGQAGQLRWEIQHGDSQPVLPKPRGNDGTGRWKPVKCAGSDCFGKSGTLP